jgi:copper(I)-binding protein
MSMDAQLSAAHPLSLPSCRTQTMQTHVLLLSALVSLVAFTASARDYKAGTLTITDAWSRATPKGAAVGGGYLKITNNGTTADRLISGSSEIAGSFQVHEMTMEKGVAKMRLLKDGLEIKPGQTVELKPGGFHIMFADLKQPLNKGDHFKATLVFEKAGTVEVEYDVLAIGASPTREPPGKQMHHH